MLKFVALILALYSSILSACPAKKLPYRDLDKYETIYIGQVTGVHLTAYEKSMVEGLRKEAGYSYWTDTTQEYEVTVLPQRLRKGHVSELAKHKIAGCGVVEPRVRNVGLFFVQPDGETHVLYNGESYHYEEYIELVGSYWLKQRKRLKIDRNKNANQ